MTTLVSGTPRNRMIPFRLYAEYPGEGGVGGWGIKNEQTANNQRYGPAADQAGDSHASVALLDVLIQNHLELLDDAVALERGEEVAVHVDWGF